jgi:16S rRNA (guanine527-N7)-methyltransferase
VSAGEDRLLETLERARQLGFLGPGPVTAHLSHALGFVEVIAASGISTARLLDLGTGGGVPGLALADRFPRAGVVLLEASQRRAEFLRLAVAELGWTGRVEVLRQRAEEAAHRADYRESFTVVTARSFAGPAATAEIAAGLLAVGGHLVVSEPPQTSAERWPSQQLAALGLGAAEPRAAAAAHFVVITKVAPVQSDVPRGTGRPTKRPRW